MRNGRLKLGIVGGLGARGGADILNKLVAATPVKSESDHREILFEQKPLSEPIPVSRPDYLPTHRKFYVFDTLTRMEQNGCDAALLPCFITHTFLEELAAELPIELISIGDAIVAELARHHGAARRIGVLTTPYVRRNGFFQRMLTADQQVLYPDAGTEAALLEAIYGPGGFKAGRPLPEVLPAIRRAVAALLAQGAEVIIPGMTELPVIFGAGDVIADAPILDVNQIYARFALAQTSGRRPAVFKVGVVGGVGPAATVDFLKKIVEGTAAERDQDHIKLIVEQNPQIPDRTENLVKGGPDPTLALYATCKKLERAGAQAIAIPCNTAHAFVDRIQKNLDIPIISILTETARFIGALHPEIGKVAVLATSGTIQSGLYQSALRDQGLDPVLPDAGMQEMVMEVIYCPSGVKAGFTTGRCAAQLAQVIAAMTGQGAQAAILGCTELPLVHLPAPAAIRLIDPTEVLARACVQAAISARARDFAGGMG